MGKTELQIKHFMREWIVLSAFELNNDKLFIS